jgi:hypothetical protein
MSLDLDVENYNINELEKLFGLNQKYDATDVNSKELKLKKKLLASTSVTESLREKIIQFVLIAKNKIMHELKKLNESSLSQTYELTHETMNPLIKVNDNYIQQKKEVEYLYSKPSEYFPGKINPLAKRIIRQTLNIDSRFRDNYYSTTNLSTNYHYDLPLIIKNVVSMQLVSMDFPCTFYNISSNLNNNYFSLIIDNVNFNVTIPDGNYNPTDLINYINNLLSNTDGNFKYIVFEIDLSFTASGTGKMIVGVNKNYNGMPFDFSIDFVKDINGHENKSIPLPLKIGWMMGFRNGVYVNNSTYISEGIIDTLAHRYIYLVVNDYNNNVNDGFYASFTDSILNKNILARISIQTSGFNIISQNNLGVITYPRQYFGPVNIQKLQIQLLDEYGRVLNLNNMDYSICLTMETIYDL